VVKVSSADVILSQLMLQPDDYSQGLRTEKNKTKQSFTKQSPRQLYFIITLRKINLLVTVDNLLLDSFLIVARYISRAIIVL
jgi:hypothetical protein